MEEILIKLSWAVLALAGGFVVWAIKGLVKVVFENRDKIKDGYFKNVEQDKAIVNLQETVRDHDTKIEQHDRAISTIVTTHNNSSCGRSHKIEIKV